MMTQPLSSRLFDVIVVGSGAGGSAATHRLVRAGRSVLLVEKGKSLPRDGSTLDVRRVIHEGAFKSSERWLDASGRTLVPEEYFNVGGKTKWYGAALARFRPIEFEAEAQHQCVAWPIAYRDLAPYYDEIESLLGIRTFAIEPDLERIVDRLQRAAPDWRTESLPMGLSAGIAGHPNEAAHFDGFASAAGLKSDGEVSLLDKLASSSSLERLTGRTVTGLVGDVSEPTRIVGVRLDDGSEHYAHEIVLAAGALHTPRIVQAYLEDRGLQSLPLADVVGRYLKLHLLTAVLAISPRRKTDLLRKTTLLVNDRLPHSSVQPLGFDGELIADLIPRFVPRALARRIGERAYGFFLQTEDGSSEDNRVSAGRGVDVPPTIDYDRNRIPAARDEHRTLVRRFCRDLRRAGYLALSQPIGLHGTAHACGTMRAGTNPRNSAVDACGRVHGLEGLRVADGSILPRSSRVNPALTIYAWALHVANEIAKSRESRVSVGQSAAFERAAVAMTAQ